MIARNIVWVIAPFLFLIAPKILSGWPLIMGVSSWFSRNLNQFPKWICACVPLWFGFLSIASIAWGAFPDQQLDYFIQRLPGLFAIALMIVTLSVTPDHFFKTFHSIWRRIIPTILVIFLLLMVNPYNAIEIANYNRMFVMIAVLSIPIIVNRYVDKGFRSALFFYILMCLTLYVSEASAGFSAALISLPLLWLTQRHFRVIKNILMVALPLSIIVMPFVMSFVWEYAQALSFLNDASTGGRLEIWHGLSTIIIQNWGYGWGYDVTRFIELPINHIFFSDDQTLHPHNMSMQMWIEYGVIGAFGLAVMWFELLRRATSPLMIAGLASIFIIGSLSYGVWQNDWLGLCVFAWFYLNASQKFLAKPLGTNIQ